jgi:hypothetical protein
MLHLFRLPGEIANIVYRGIIQFIPSTTLITLLLTPQYIKGIQYIIYEYINAPK